MESNSKSRSPSPMSDNSPESPQTLSNSDLKDPLKEIDSKSESKKHETSELISNFSVASLLADTKSSSPKQIFWKTSDWFLTNSSNLSHDSPSLKMNDIDDQLPINETDIFLVDRTSRSQMPQRPPHPRIPSGIWTVAGQRPLLHGTQWPLSLQTTSQSKSIKLLFII